MRPMDSLWESETRWRRLFLDLVQTKSSGVSSPSLATTWTQARREFAWLTTWLLKSMLTISSSLNCRSDQHLWIQQQPPPLLERTLSDVNSQSTPRIRGIGKRHSLMDGTLVLELIQQICVRMQQLGSIVIIKRLHQVGLYHSQMSMEAPYPHGVSQMPRMANQLKTMLAPRSIATWREYWTQRILWKILRSVHKEP